MIYRLLTGEEISLLISQGCFADNWSDISVNKEFSPDNIRNTRFEGKVKLGIITGTIEIEKGRSKKCGIFNSNIMNCEIAGNVYISEAKNLANYIIEENVSIENVGSLIVKDESSFGNGTEIEVLNEAGGRELPIFDRLSSQIAYLTVLYRHDKEFTNKLLRMIRDYAGSKEVRCRKTMEVLIGNHIYKFRLRKNIVESNKLF